MENVFLFAFLLVAACRSVNTVLQKQLTEEKNNKEELLRLHDQLSQVRNFYTPLSFKNLWFLPFIWAFLSKWSAI